VAYKVLRFCVGPRGIGSDGELVDCK